MTIANYTLQLDSTARVNGPNYFADRAAITVTSGGRLVTVVHPEKRSYPVEQTGTTESAIRTTGISDLYVVLGDQQQGGGWIVRAYVSPLAPFIWLGGCLMARAGFIAIGALALARIRAVRARVTALPEAAQ